MRLKNRRLLANNSVSLPHQKKTIMHFKRILPILIAGLLMPFLIMAQVTTSSITGFVKAADGEPLDGATITAIHIPSGTKYATISKRDGNFTIPNTRIGGPYTITAEYVGYATQSIEDVQLSLGQPYNAQFALSQQASVLSEITIAGLGRPTVVKTGASTVLNSEQISTLPSISRSITDFTRLTPQASGTSFAGQDSRYNNLQVDGANLNNNFGLSGDPLPGGGASPISIAAFDEISVNIAPFDVRQSGFTGAGINVTTKSGTNTFHGSAYGFYRDQSFNGKYIGKTELTPTPSKNKIYGATLGGPIIKDKLFFFANAEWENSAVPNANTYVPAGSSASGRTSASPKDSLDKFSGILKSKYGYEAGVYDNRPNYETKNRKFLGKIDWNISDKHKLVLKYSDFKGSDQSPLNSSSVPNGGGFKITNPTTIGNPGGPDRFGSYSRLPNNRNSSESIGLSNSDYATDHIVQSATLELNSNFSSKISNQLLLAYTHINDVRNSPGGMFPTVEIFNGDGTVDGVGKGENYMSAGTDPFTRNNEVVNNIASLTNNFTYYAGRHTLLAGVNYELQKLGNAFMQGSEGYFVYNTLHEFEMDAPPAFYAYTYSLVPGEAPKVFSANLKIGQLGIYLQDEFNINSNFKLTFGIRGDLPTYLENPVNNPAITALKWPAEGGGIVSYSAGEWPKSRLLLSPRAGFNWKVPGQQGMIIRGGAGIFTGKIPFVFLTNMPSNSGVYQNGVVVTDSAELSKYKFNPDPDGYRNNFPDEVTPVPPNAFVVIDPDFKFPQVFRVNFGVDKQLGNGFTVSGDMIYTKAINAVKMRNLNLPVPTDRLTGLDSRPYFPKGTSNKLDPSLGEEIILENTQKGYAFSATGIISKRVRKGFYGSLAYTYSLSTEISPNPGSRATSAWESIANRGTPNDEELYYSQYAIPHRVVGNISYRLEYANHIATTLSLFYEGSNGSNYSYIVAGDINNDGSNKSDLMYIYDKGSDVPFIDVPGKFTIKQQQDAYDQFVESSPYLRKHKGQYAERNSALTPWFNKLDARLLQDFYVKAGGTKHNLQIIVDVINLPNLISHDWGIRKQYSVNNPLNLQKGVADAGKPTFTMATQKVGDETILRTDAFEKVQSFSTTWGLQLGLKYFF